MRFNNVASELRPMVEAIHRDKIRRAQAMTPDQRMEAALDMIDFAYETMENGIRNEQPKADQDTITRILRDRLSKIRRRSRIGILMPINPAHETK
jgi:hypothetical protein